MIGTFSPKQAHSIGSATAKICIWNGAVSAGKTVASLFRLLTAISEAPTTGEIVIIRRTRDTVNRNIMTLLQDPALFGNCPSRSATTVAHQQPKSWAAPSTSSDRRTCARKQRSAV